MSDILPGAWMQPTLIPMDAAGVDEDTDDDEDDSEDEDEYETDEDSDDDEMVAVAAQRKSTVRIWSVSLAFQVASESLGCHLQQICKFVSLEPELPGIRALRHTCVSG